jgi:flagellar basal-body rod protein FlgB
VLAVNVANSDTPDFTPQDISEGDFAQAMKQNRRAVSGVAKVVRTHAGHLQPPSSRTREWRADDAPDSETTMDGNAVVLEEQMAKVAETRMRYEAALGLYEKALGLIRIAGKSPTR